MVATRPNVIQAWRDRAGELARWTSQRLVNRTDAWAAVLPIRKQAPGRFAAINRGDLAEAVLVRHYAGQKVRDLLGVHSTSTERTCRWMAIRAARFDNDDPATPGNYFHAALAWFEKLQAMGFDPILEQADDKLYRLLVMFDFPVEAIQVVHFAEQLVSDFADNGLQFAPRTLPNRTCLEGDGLDDWFMLPGRHPQYPEAQYFSRVWDGNEWVEGIAAISALLSARPAGEHCLRMRMAAVPAPVVAQAHRTRSDPATAPEGARPAQRRPARQTQQPPAEHDQAEDHHAEHDHAEHERADSDESDKPAPPARAVDPPAPPTATAPPAATQRHAKETAAMPAAAQPNAPAWHTLPDDAHRVVDALASSRGMRHEEVVRRLFAWFDHQDETVQAVILGQIPDAIRPDIWKLVLDSVAKAEPVST